MLIIWTMSTLLHDRVRVEGGRLDGQTYLISYYNWVTTQNTHMAGYSYTQGIGEGPLWYQYIYVCTWWWWCRLSHCRFVSQSCCYVNRGYLLFIWGSLSAQYKLAYRVRTYDLLLISLSYTTPICTHIPGEQETVSWHQCHLRPGLLQLSAWQSAAGGRLRTRRQERQGTA